MVSALRLCGTLAFLAILPSVLHATPTLQPPFDADYTLVDLGPVADVHLPYGGLAFAPGDTGGVIIGGWGQTEAGYLYVVEITRDVTGTIDGFVGPAVPLADALGIDGGIAFGPGDVLFYSGVTNVIGEVKPGSATTDKVVSLASVTPWHPGGLAIVPPGFGDPGQLKFASWATGEWWSLTLVPDGTGTYGVAGAAKGPTLAGGPEGLAYVLPASPGFPNPSIVVCEWTDGKVSAYEIDAAGDPVVATRREMITGIAGAEGATTDPLTGDFLITTYQGKAFVVRNAAVPATTTSTTSSSTSTSTSSTSSSSSTSTTSTTVPTTTAPSTTTTTTSGATSTTMTPGSTTTTTPAPPTTSTAISTTTTTVSPSTTTSKSSTTTTIPPECAGGASFESIACGVDALLDLVRPSSDLGRLHDGFVARLEDAQRAVAEAAAACAAGRRSEARHGLKTVERQMIVIRSRLRTRRTRRSVPKDLAGGITTAARDIGRDARTLRASLACGVGTGP